MFDRLRRACALDFWRDTQGGIAMVFGLTAIPLCLAVGVAVDAGRAYVVETRLMSAIDAAALAAASPDLNSGDENTTRQTIARTCWEYFRRNYGLGTDEAFDLVSASYDDSEGDGLNDITVASTDGRVSLEIVRQDEPNQPDIVVTARSRMPTTFMRIAGIPDIEVAASTEVTGSRQGLELVLVMDNTGSMRDGGSHPPAADSSMERMKDAAQGLINRLYLDQFDTDNRYDAQLQASGGNVIDTLWIGLVPYAATVNIGRTSQFQEWSEASGWSYRSFHPNPDPDAPAETTVDHMDWLSVTGGGFSLMQLQAYRNAIGQHGPEESGETIDSYYLNSVRAEHGTYYEALCLRDDEDWDDDDNYDEYRFETDGFDITAHDRDQICEWVEGDPRGWLGCVLARDGTYNVSETPPDTGVADTLFTPFRWVSDSDTDPDPGADERNTASYFNAWEDGLANNGNPIYWGENARQNRGRGPNLGCPPPITPMSNDYTVIMDAIEQMEPWHRGGTWSHLGMAWGWRLISPEWRTQWSLPYEYEGQQLPLDYGNEDIQKVVVVLTDGTNQWYQDDFTSHGFLSEARLIADGGLGTDSASSATNEANNRMLTICRNMRGEATEDNDPNNDNIVIYTIVLDASGQEATFRNCASAVGNYFTASNSGELASIFEQIADELSALRISR
jgi:Flp pilus assembly protein TadG